MLLMSCGIRCWIQDLGKGVAGNCSGRALCERSGIWGKLQQVIEIQWEKTRYALQITDYGHVEKVFTKLRHELNRSENDEMFDLKTC